MEADRSLSQDGQKKLARHLQSIGIPAATCPICHQENWEGYTDVAVPIAAARNSETGEIDGIPGSVHALAVTCLTCGFMAHFDYDVLEGRIQGAS